MTAAANVLGADAAAVPRVRVQAADFDVGAEIRGLGADGRVGAIASFIGLVRDHEPAAPDDAGGGRTRPLARLTLEHYPGMTERAIESMVDAATRRFGLCAARVVHRIGPLAPGAQIVLVLAAAPHRHAAIEACDFLMDFLKTQAPFWKKAEQADGGTHWVDARVSDDAAMARWGDDDIRRHDAG